MKSTSVFQALLGLLFIVGGPLGYVVYSTHECNSTSTWCPSLLDFLPSLGVAVLLIVLRNVFLVVTRRFACFVIHRGKCSDAIYEGKLMRGSHNLFKTLYFLVVSVTIFNILQNEPFFPEELGGKLSSSSIKFFTLESEILPSRIFLQIQYYFYLAAGFQLASFYVLLAESQHVDTWETLVQVVLALQLIVYGYMGRHLAVGACLMLMHDMCDVLVSLCKALVDSSYKMSTFMSAIGLMVMWAYARLYCFVTLILTPLLQHIESQQSWLTGNWESVLFAVLLLSLFLMNIYWFSLMAKSCFYFVNYGKLTDAHAPALQESAKPHSE